MGMNCKIADLSKKEPMKKDSEQRQTPMTDPENAVIKHLSDILTEVCQGTPELDAFDILQKTAALMILKGIEAGELDFESDPPTILSPESLTTSQRNPFRDYQRGFSRC